MSIKKQALVICDPWFARWSYERLLILQPHIKTEGLWYADGKFYIVCPNLDTRPLSDDGQFILDWFKANKAIGTRITWVSKAPSGASLAPARTASERAELKGEPLTNGEVYFNLLLQLPKGFPQFGFDSSWPHATVTVSCQLSPEEDRQLHRTYASFDIPLELVIAVNPKRWSKSPAASVKHSGHDLRLLPSKALSSEYGSALKAVIEEDEDQWMTQRRRLFSTNELLPADCLPKTFGRHGLRCIVNASTFPPGNIRLYLPLYQHTVIIAPLAEFYERSLAALNVSEEDLICLAERGRVQFLFPQPVDRYPLTLLNRVAEEAPDSMLFSRRLAAATVADCRRRLPLLYPVTDIDERHNLLSILWECCHTGDSKLRSIATVLFEGLKEIWTASEHPIHCQGAMATSRFGMGPIVAAFIREFLKKDLWLESFAAAGPVEWAGVLRAHIFPVVTPQYSEQGLVELFSCIYSGVPSEPGVSDIGKSEIVLHGLFTIDNDAPVLDVETAFSVSDIDRIHKIVEEMIRCRCDEESLTRAINDFNARVTAYESRTNHLRSLDILGLAGALAPLIGGTHGVAKFAALGIWMLRQLFASDDVPRSRAARHFLEIIRATNAWTTSEVVLVNRLRRCSAQKAS